MALIDGGITFEDVHELLLDRAFLVACGSRKQSAQERLDMSLQLVAESQCSFDVQQFVQLFFGWGGLCGDESGDELDGSSVIDGGTLRQATGSVSATQRVGLLQLCGAAQIELKEVTAFIVRQLLECDAFSSVIRFDFFPTLRGGTCQCSRAHVIEMVTRTNGLLDLVQDMCCEAVLLLLYYFLSTEFYEAANVWSAGIVVQPDNRLHLLCASLLKFSESAMHPIRDYAITLRSGIAQVAKLKIEEHDLTGPIQPPLHVPSHTILEQVHDHAVSEQLTALQHQMMRQTEIIVQLQERLHEQQTVHNQQILALQERIDQLSFGAPRGRAPSIPQSPEGGPSGLAPPPPSQSSSVSMPKDAQAVNPPEPHSITQPYEGRIGSDPDWSGLCHPACNSKTQYALLQSSNGQYTSVNKASGRGYVALSVDNHPKLVVTSGGSVGVGTVTPQSSLDVNGAIRCQDGFASCSPERLVIVRGGFSCRTADPHTGPGYRVKCFGNGMLEIYFTKPFSSRPNVIAIQHITGDTPTLIPLGYVDAMKFGFYEISRKPDVWIEFYAMGPSLASGE